MGSAEGSHTGQMSRRQAGESGQGWTRRQLFRRGGLAAAGLGGLGAASFVGYAWPRGTPAANGSTAPSQGQGGSASAGQPAMRRLVTRPDLDPPAVSMTYPRYPGLRTAGALSEAAQSPYVFLAVRGYRVPVIGRPDLMIVDRAGRPVWLRPSPKLTAANLAVQRYRGEPVLTWWQGKMSYGHGKGKAYIADSSYRVIATVQAGHGLSADLHEFTLTSQNTALITAYRKAHADLSGLGGRANGVVMSGVAQEIDVATGKVLFEWDSLDHVAITESYQKLSGTGINRDPFDYFHINSIQVAPDGDLIISARNTWAVYKVARADGTIRWRLGGKKSDFRMGPGARFYWQHHAVPHGPTMLSIFDDGSSPPEEAQSRAILLDLDTNAMRATLKRSYTHPARLLADNQGNVQVLPDGRVFVGWGAEPYFTEFAQDGDLLLDGQLPVGDQSYRAVLGDWVGHPDGRPAVTVRRNPARGSAVYVSWNGATEVQTWEVLAGKEQSALTTVGAQRWAGFETVIVVNSDGPYFAVTARDSKGQWLGRSATVKGPKAD